MVSLNVAVKQVKSLPLYSTKQNFVREISITQSVYAIAYTLALENDISVIHNCRVSCQSNRVDLQRCT